jgi:hypothetical protein
MKGLLKSKTVKRILGQVLALVLALAVLSPISVQAKTKTVYPVWSGHTYNTSVKSAESASKKIGTGTTKVVLRSNFDTSKGYVKFKALKSKTYTITLNGVMGERLTFARIQILKHTTQFDNYLNAIQFNQYGYILQLATKNIMNNYKSIKVKVKLKKGETIYSYAEINHDYLSKKKFGYKITIK